MRLKGIYHEAYSKNKGAVSRPNYFTKTKEAGGPFFNKNVGNSRNIDLFLVFVTCPFLR